jgi:putative inorganic carbon (HCO3(-)) transporter
VRDFVLLLVLAGTIPLVLRTPIIGLLAWIWTSVMVPQREVYGLLRDANLNFYIAALTFAAWMLSKDRKPPPANPMLLLLIAFAGWMSLTTVYALDRDYAYPLWDRTLKSIVLVLAVAAFATTKLRIQAVVWTLAVSLAYYGFKGGVFVLATGGRHHVYGPPETMIGDNNCLGLALVAVLPLLVYLRRTSRVRATRTALLAAMILTLVAVVGTYSRGALVTLVVAGSVYAIRSRGGVVLVILGGLLASAAPSIMPGKWMERMSTIQTYDADASFNGRVAAWRTSYEIASQRPLGGGFSAVKLDEVARMFPAEGGLTMGRAAHSIYFEVLGDHGFIGLALYLLVIAAALLNTFQVLALARRRPDLAWASQLARMLQVSIVAFLVGGSALSMAYYDGVLIILALTVAVLRVAREPARAEQTSPRRPNWSTALVGLAPGPKTAAPRSRLPIL